MYSLEDLLTRAQQLVALNNVNLAQSAKFSERQLSILIAA